jgi:hypothetical protein
MTIKACLSFGLLALGLGCLAGCRSAGEPGSQSHASVQVKGKSVAEIQQAATAVFGEEGYAPVQIVPNEMVFERPGSRRDALKWGGWEGSGVTMHVKVKLSEPARGLHLLEADAYAIQNSDDPFFRTERRNILLNRRPYQKLLDKVAKRLK